MSKNMPAFDPVGFQKNKPHRWVCLALLSHELNATWMVDAEALMANGSAAGLGMLDDAVGGLVGEKFVGEALGAMLAKALDNARREDGQAPEVVGSMAKGVFKCGEEVVAAQGVHIQCQGDQWAKWRDWMGAGLSERLGGAVYPVRDWGNQPESTWRAMAEAGLGAARAAMESRAIAASARLPGKSKSARSEKGSRI
jgi:hypothetical protein